MPHVGSEVDASFYQLIHTMLETPRGTPGPERRSERRRTFRIEQRIAHWDGNRFPDDREFVTVQCHDLTRSGFSFLSVAEPTTSMLVVEFGTRSNSFYVVAQILHIVPAMCYPSGAVVRLSGTCQAVPEIASAEDEGTMMFLVGCRFVRRLRKPS